MGLRKLISKSLRYYRNPIVLKANMLNISERFVEDLLVIKNNFKTIPKTIIDIGAATGEWAIAANFLFPDSNIYAFEPIEDSFDLMTQKIVGKNIHLYAYALSFENSQRKFFLTGNMDSSSFYKISDKQLNDFPEIENQKEIAVETRRLDEIMNIGQMEKPILCKVDVHGADLEVFEGMGNLIDQIDIIQIEVLFRSYYENMPSAINTLDFLFSKGFNSFYQVETIMNRQTGEIQFCDLIFQR